MTQERQQEVETQRQNRLELRRPFIERANQLTDMLTTLRQEFDNAKAALRETYREKRRRLSEEHEGDFQAWWDSITALKAWKRDEFTELREDYENDRRDLEQARGRVAAEMKQAEREAGYR